MKNNFKKNSSDFQKKELHTLQTIFRFSFSLQKKNYDKKNANFFLTYFQFFFLKKKSLKLSETYANIFLEFEKKCRLSKKNLTLLY